MRRTRLSQGYEMAFVSPLAPVTKFPTSFLPCSVQRAKQTRRARHIIVPTAGYERDSYGRSAVTQPKKSSVSYRPPMRSRKGQTSFKNTVRFPPGKLPFSLEIDFVLNHPITDAIIAALVALNCLIFPLQTIDVGPALHKAFVAYEHNLTIVFLIEYFGRWYGKALCLRYLLTRGMIIDFLAVAPFAFDVADQSEALFVRLLRLSRILRIQRVFMDTDRSADLTGSMTAIQVTLANIGLSLFNLLYVSAGLFYIAEKDVNPNVLNFFDAFYYSTITLFTVGFGDVTPLTSWGRTSKYPVPFIFFFFVFFNENMLSTGCA